ncbi:MAG TPA: PaaI family thioesterase [Stellaceae bacterium]|nr:PaaI family thioesterase [Stellaceae bacterium]
MVPTALDTLPPPPCAELLGWKLLDARPEQGWVRIGFAGRPEFCNPAGVIQGGLLSAMLDDTMGPAVFVKTNGRLYSATITLTVSFLAPAKIGPIIAEASVVQLGKSVAFMEGKLTDDAGKLLATATATARLVETGKAIGTAAPPDRPAGISHP